MTIRIGSLCTGYGGLDHAVQAVLGGEIAWVSDIDPGACKILAHRYPGVPNIGDMTTVDWSAVGRVDVLTAGYPCQPFSHAGKRKGTKDVRHLWPHVREAIRILRPRLTVLENVAGHRSLGFDRVLGDMAEDGLHVRWASLRAADIGLCHGRERVFISATPADADREHGGQRWLTASTQAPRRRAHGGPPGCGGVGALLPTPTSRDHKGRNQRDDETCLTGALLPTPRAQNCEGRNQAVWPRDPSQPQNLENALAHTEQSWREYEGRIRLHEAVTGRPAPPPTEPGRNGGPRLSPRFVEWMQALPDGWVADVPGITRNEALRALGNGVVPPQAETALRFLLAMREAAA